MEVNSNNIYNLLSANVEYRIPHYQRQYSWQQKPQCEELWQDIERIIEANTGDAPKQLNHFIGTIVMVQLQDDMGMMDYDCYHLIDGQQRLTSISLVIIALRHYVQRELELFPQEQNYIDLCSALNGLLYRETDTASGSKLFLSKADQQALESLLSGQVSFDNKPADTASLLIRNCYFFYSKWVSFFNKNRAKVPLSEQTVKPLFERLLFAQIALDPSNKDNPQQVFESLNSTGMNLTQSDLIRNFLLMNMDLETQREMYQRYWVKMEDNLKQNLADFPNSKADLDLFFLNFLTSRLGEIPNKEDIYNKFKEWFRKNVAPQYETSEDPAAADKDCLQQLCDAHTVWCRMYWSQGDSRDPIDRACYELRLLDRDVLNPVMFELLYDQHLGRISLLALQWSLRFLCSYCVRLFSMIERVSNLMNKHFTALLRKLNNSAVNSEDQYLIALIGHLCPSPDIKLGRVDEKLKCPQDKDFHNFLCSHHFATLQDKPYALFMLLMAERYQNKEYSILKGPFVLDYVLPAKLSDDKALELTEEQGWDEELIKLAGHREWSDRLGNLTLRQTNDKKPLPINKATWLSFKARKEEFAKQLKRHVNCELQNPKEQWTEQDIRGRGERLADWLLQVFPYPDINDFYQDKPKS